MVEKSTRSITQHVFATLTYKREYDLVECWKRLPKDFNRFIQNQRRLHRNGLQYIRSVEAHGDLYPHIHVVLQHQYGISVSNRRYFEDDLYKKWKSLWKCGLSDFQPPLSGSLYPTLYIVKYIAKDSSLRTLWKRFYSMQPRTAMSATNVVPSSVTTEKPFHASMNTETSNPSLFFCKQFKIKQVTWSRKYKFPVKQPQPLLVAQSLLTRGAQEPCLNRA